MDGPMLMDIAAPDDPLTTLAEIPAGSALGNPEPIAGGYMKFGGTSGAGPHVAATIALLTQLFPESTLEDRISAIQQGAETEPDMGELPAGDWGYGRLSLTGAIAWLANETGNAPPSAVLAVTAGEGLTAELDASASADPEGGLVQVRWDVDGDGAADGPWEDSLTRSETYATAGTWTARVEVRDPLGAIAEDSATFELTLPPEPEPEPPVEPVNSAPEEPAATAEVAAEIPQPEAPPADSSGCDCHSVGRPLATGPSPPAGPAALILLLGLAFLVGRDSRRAPR